MAIVRRKAAAGVSAALLHFAAACSAAGVAVPPVWPPGKGCVTLGQTAMSSSRASVSARSSSYRRRPRHWPTGPWVLLTGAPQGG